MTPEFTPSDVRRMELAASRAWPADATADIDGWLWRGSGGGSRRANSVLPLDFRGASVNAAIAAVEARYRAQGTRSYFQVVSIAEPCGLEARLEDRGYAPEEPCLLLARTLAPSPMPADIEVSAEPTSDWFEVYGATLEPARRQAAPALLARVPRPRAFLLARRDGVPTASALSVVSRDGVAMVECVATVASARRSGAARTIMDALESWSAKAGANLAALQVVAENHAARALYQGRGYTVAGAYHYRWRDV